jgi:hypothetical protein
VVKIYEKRQKGTEKGGVIMKKRTPVDLPLHTHFTQF